MIKNNELITIVGGSFSFSATLLNSFSRSVDTVLNLGRTFGTSWRMLVRGLRC